MRDKKWEASFIGVIANENDVDDGKNSIFINNQNSLQFYIKIISAEPYSFPRNVRLVSCFSGELEKWGFEDEVYENDFTRKERLRAFLSNNLIVFNPELRVRHDFQEFYVAKNLHLLTKNDSFHDSMHLNGMPIFNEDSNSIDKNEFESRISQMKFVGNNYQISKEENDTPQFIIWEDKHGEMTVYGEFETHTHAYGGFRFKPSSLIKYITLKSDLKEEAYRYKQVIFIDNTVFANIIDALKFGNIVLEEEVSENQSGYRIETSIEEKEENELYKEQDFIRDFIQTTKEMNLLYDEQDLVNFHTSVKTSNLVILAGMSGTGKSKLVQAYWKALGIDREQLTIIPVRPSWADDSDLIGYADTVNMVYRPGDSGLINTLIKAEREQDKLFILCFDEMNLARVEHYFSQFLSVLEMEEGKKELSLYNEQLANRLYNSSQFPPTVTIGDNVIFIGTVNIDESTYHFSDKVLDRANVIDLKVLPFSSLVDLGDEKKKNIATTDRVFVTKEIYDSFKVSKRVMNLKEEELTFFWNVHKVLQSTDRSMGIGPRVVRQIDKYLKNIPSEQILDRETAIDLQFVQRIMTKIRGSEEQLEQLIGTYNRKTKEVVTSLLLDEIIKHKTVSHFRETKKIILQKAKELKINGHTI